MNKLKELQKIAVDCLGTGIEQSARLCLEYSIHLIESKPRESALQALRSIHYSIGINSEEYKRAIALFDEYIKELNQPG